MSFRWLLGDYTGGAYAVHQSYKPFLCMRPDDWAGGEFLMQPRDTSDIVVSGLDFRPDVLMFVSFRPKLANLTTDSAFGDRGGGYTFGVAGHSTNAALWDSATAYVIGNIVKHEGVIYEATGNNTNDEPPSGNWAGLSYEQFTGSTTIRHAFNVPNTQWFEDRCFSVTHVSSGIPILEFDLQSFDADGFTLNVPTNLYDQSDYVAWLAMSGDFKVGIFDAGTTSVSFNGTPQGAMFLSSKFQLSDTNYLNERWDHMQGFASPHAQACVWGGRRQTSWDWTTEHWRDDDAIVLARAASGSSLVGTGLLAVGHVANWNVGSIDISWSVFDNNPYRIGYMLCGNECEAGVLETNTATQPGGSQNTPPGGGSNLQVTAMKTPHVILMTGTNYNFDRSNLDAFDLPRDPNVFQKGGSGGLGWHFAPFSELGYDSYGVHTYGNAVAEIGHYANSGTQYTRRYIMAGQGATSNPPAYHQHSVNVIANPVIVGTNYRYAERHAHVKRIHINPSDQYAP